MRKLLIPIITTALISTSVLTAYASGTDNVNTTTAATQTVTTVTPTPTVVPEATATPTPTTAPVATVTPTPTTTPTPTVTPAPEETDENVEQTAGITPDSLLYPFERLVESVQVSLTFSSEGKADLQVGFANERLAEAAILSEKSKLELVQEVLEEYAKIVGEANKNLEDAANEGKDVTPLIDEIKVTEDAAGKIVIQITGTVPEDKAEALKTAITNEVKKTLVVEAISTAKANFSVAKKQVELAREEYKAAEKTGDQAVINAAIAKLAEAEDNKIKTEAIKNAAEAYKEVYKTINEDKEDEDKDEDKDESKVEKKDKIEKMNEQIAKHEEKKTEVAEKVREKNENAANKIEENTKRQVEKKKEQVEKFKNKASDNRQDDKEDEEDED